jgi:TolB-like protein/Tfp pilus assembly protein PilF
MTDVSTEPAVERAWDKLRRRKVVQWGIVYAAGAWGFLQGLEYVSESFGWPGQLRQIAILALLIGLPVVLVTAWYHGDQGRQRVSAAELIIITLLFLIGGGIFWRYDKASDAPSPATASPGQPSVGASAAADIPDKSIAVLPFVNMSGDPDNEYFSDGISEEILNVLAGRPELQVAARTSSFSFKGKPMEVPEIAAALNVRMVLEGSVRRQGDKVRITAQLIDAQNGFHLWSQTYDRKLEDIFAIQDEIARAIGDELKVKIASPVSPGQDSTGTRNLEAYDLYLRGMSLWHTRNEQKLWQAVDLFNQAIATDPKFAQAYGGLALTFAVLPDYSARISYENSFRLLTDAAGMALGLDPTLPEPYAALAQPASWERRRKTALTLYRRAIAIRPSFATAYQWLGTDSMADGDPQAGLEALDRASELDPRSLVVAANRSYVLLTLGRVTDARTNCERVLAFAPDYVGCQQQVALAELLRGDPDAARPYLQAIARTGDGSALPLVDAVVNALKVGGDQRATAQRLAAFSGRSALDPTSGNVFTTAETPALLVLLGAPELALDYLERSADEPESTTNLLEWPMMLPALDPVRCTPRFKALVERLKTRDPRAATVCAVGSK